MVENIITLAFPILACLSGWKSERAAGRKEWAGAFYWMCWVILILVVSRLD